VGPQEAVEALFDTLAADQRQTLCFPWDSPERTRWQYTPGRRPGLALADLREPQQEAALALLRSALGDEAFAAARSVMALESVLRRLEERAGVAGAERRHPLHYWFAVFGAPHRGPEEPWGWRVGGHHLSVHVTVVGDAVVVLPLFLGANPATAPDGSRTLAQEEDLGRRLLASLDEGQTRAAVVSDRAPSDILTGNATRAELAAVPVGLRFDDLGPTQRGLLTALLQWYVGRANPAPPVRSDGATFAWLGSTEPGGAHYYAVRAGTFFVELDNSQDGANHVHTVVRDSRRDWGDDLLGVHYRGAHP
jgi:hypothetical protein